MKQTLTFEEISRKYNLYALFTPSKTVQKLLNDKVMQHAVQTGNLQEYHLCR